MMGQEHPVSKRCASEVDSVTVNPIRTARFRPSCGLTIEWPVTCAATEAAFDCVKKGEACIAHCLALLSTGDTTMAECAAAAHDMVAAAQALAVIGSSGSKHIAAAARLALEACTDCEAACRQHADKHVICRECADSCARTVAACRALV